MDKKTSPSRAKSSKAGTKEKSSNLVSKKFKIGNELGLHARAAAQFVKIASRFGAEIHVQKDSRKVNGKSIMGILMLAASKGSLIQVTAQGADSGEAMRCLEELIEGKFGEK